MKEIHHIWHWNQLETNLYFVLILLKTFLTFSIAKRTRNKLIPIKICFELLPLSNLVFLICGSTLTLISHFFLILDISQNAYLTLNIHISAKWQPKTKDNISKSNFIYWQSKRISFLKIPFLLCISRLIKQEYFFVSPGRCTNTNLQWRRLKHPS